MHFSKAWPKSEAMLRDKSLIPFSHQHQHALALCVRIDRALKAGPLDEKALAGWQAEIARIFATEILVHFAAEEQILFPAASRFGPLRLIVEALLRQHTTLRSYAEKAKTRELDAEELLGFAETLSNHVRAEERGLFEGCQKLMAPEELALMGKLTEEFFRRHGVLTTACALPDQL
jgi:hemerythrin-like domain-containing protein